MRCVLSLLCASNHPMFMVMTVRGMVMVMVMVRGMGMAVVGMVVGMVMGMGVEVKVGGGEFRGWHRSTC